MRSIHISLCGLLAAAVPAAAAAGTVSWPQPGMNAAHTGFNKKETTLTTGNVGSLTRSWIAPTGSYITAAPIEMKGVVYALSDDDNLYAFDATTGATEWTYPTGGNTSWGIAAAGSIVYADCQIDSLHEGLCALNAKTGALLWSYTINNPGNPTTVITVPVVANGLVFIELEDYGNSSYILALNATTGANVWGIGSCGDTRSTGCNNIGAPPPAVSGGALYTSTGLQNPPANTNVALCKRPAATGAAASWCFAVLDSQQALAPTVSGSKVLFASSPGDGVTTNFYALDTSGALAWSYSAVTPAAGDIHHAPAVANGIAYFSEEGSGGDEYYLYAFSLAKGKLLWSYTGGGSAGYLESGVSVANGVVYGSCEFGQCAFNATTGAPLLTTDANENAKIGAPLVANGTVVAVCDTSAICLYAP